MKMGSYEIQIPFVTTARESLKTLIDLADLSPHQKVVDLGSGNGRVVLEFARHGFDATGYEYNESLIKQAKEKAKDLGLEEKAHFYFQDFWSVDLSGYDLIYIYGMNSMLSRLQLKLEKEVRPGTKIISNVFQFPYWRPKKTLAHLHLYYLP